jgi:hypothetical protein
MGEEQTLIEKIESFTKEEIKNEFKEKILKDTMAVFKVRNDSFNFVVRLVEDRATMSKVAMIKFKINGKEFVEEIKIDPLNNILNSGTDEEVKFFIEEYIKLLTNILTDEMTRYTLTKK